MRSGLKAERRGERIARLIAGPPRDAPQAAAPDASELVPWLARGGCASLVWQLWRGKPGCQGFGWTALRYHHQVEVATRLARARWLERLSLALGDHAIPWVLLKGPATARNYDPPETRPFSDLDVLVPATLAARALVAVKPLFSRHGIPVDLHHRTPLPPFSVEQLLERAEPARVDGADVKVLPPAWALAHACLHAAHHGVVRPIWLYDIVVLSRFVDHSEWHELLRRTPKSARQWLQLLPALACSMPGWSLGSLSEAPPPPRLIRETFAQWGADDVAVGNSAHSLALGTGGLGSLVRSRWPPTIRAACALGASHRAYPAFALKSAWVVGRLPGFARRWLRSRWAQLRTPDPA